MRRVFFCLIFLFSFAYATLPVFKQTIIIFNKPSINVQPSKNLRTLAKEFGFERVGLERIKGIWQLRIEGVTSQKLVKIGSMCDLSSFFHHPECIKSWEDFHRCGEKNIHPRDEELVHKIDREFYSWLICQGDCDENGDKKVLKCDDRIKWDARWVSPAVITIEAKIGDGGFKTLDEAKESLHRINEKLKSVLYGARFPESRDEERTPNEVFWTNSRWIPVSDLPKRIKKLLQMLQRKGVIVGLSKEDIASIVKRVGAGKVVYYEACKEPGRWKSVYTNVHLDFTDRLCPRKEVKK